MIDFVIAWVDGNDKNWIKERNKYDTNLSNDISDARYRDWDLLRYWFRGVEKFAPWVNKIYFVTYGHIPEWLNTDNEKLVIVNHQDFIPKKYLPTFNSHTIELNLHKIKGLSEQFVYFNDDMFITSKVTEDYFFFRGKPCDEFVLDAIFFNKTSAGSYNGHDMELINEHFNLKQMKKEYTFRQLYNPIYGVKNLIKNLYFLRKPWYSGFHYNHLPTSILKTTMEKVWEEEEKILDDTCCDKFRTKYNINQWIFKYWQLASGNFEPRNPKHGRVFHLKSPSLGIYNAVQNGKYKMICLNDTDKTKNFNEYRNMLREAFDTLLPQKSMYEK